jgi:hypothetical protein
MERLSPYKVRAQESCDFTNKIYFESGDQTP